MTITSSLAPATEPSVHPMTVTPERALNWLDNANTRNRKISDSYAQKLARDMRAGRWMLTHEGIAFDPHGVLLDGQHRLWAVVLADVPVRMHVWFDVTPESLMVINSGRSRSLADNLRLGGGLGDVDHRELATLRAMLGRGGRTPGLTPAEAYDLLERHRHAVRFAVEHLGRTARARGLSSGETRAVVARAWYSADRSRLEHFCHVLRSSLAVGPDDEVIIALRTYLTSALGGGWRLRTERYRKTERALLAFLRSEKVAKLYAAGRELFPLPEESPNGN